jgi:hypothetical protein
MLGFANAGMQEGKSESEERGRRRGPLYVYNGKKRGPCGPFDTAKKTMVGFPSHINCLKRLK